MSFYCMCEAGNDKPDHQAFMAPNRYCASTKDDDFPPLALHRKMTCIKTGARQVIILPEHRSNDWTGPRPEDYRPHYPHVDVFECPHCHSRIVRE